MVLWVMARRKYRQFIAQAEETTLVARVELAMLCWEIEHGEPFAWEDDDA